MSYAQEKILPYSSSRDKTHQVEDMFNKIAHSYDKLNHQLSFGLDRLWRKVAIKHLKEFSPKRILDVATGTGDFAIEIAKHLKPQEIIGIDISCEMMNKAEEKTRKLGMEDKIKFSRQDSEHLEFEDESFDAITVAFGIRNFQHMDLALNEMSRVLKKGGHASILELSTPRKFPFKQLFWAYSHSALPLYGKIISKDSGAYSYLTNSIEAFPKAEVVVSALKRAGFKETLVKSLTFGVCTFYLASK